MAALSKLRTAHKRLSRCEKGPKNREKARSRVAHICQRATDLRTDFLQKLSTQLIHKNQVIMVETLGTKNLLKNRRLARAISDAGFGEFVGMLEYKCKWPGRTLVKVARFFPPSKLCCICHQKNVDLKLQDRWTCSSCHTEHQRDENAVVNIFVEGLRILAEGRSVLACGGTVGPKREFIDLCINNAMDQDKKLERSDCRMQPRSFSREVRTLLIERMTSFIKTSTFSGEPLASSRLARDQTP
ncbi:MAG: hypothetical protein DMG38_27470, partial [Acidobacteria bacterium]